MQVPGTLRFRVSTVSLNFFTIKCITQILFFILQILIHIYMLCKIFFYKYEYSLKEYQEVHLLVETTTSTNMRPLTSDHEGAGCEVLPRGRCLGHLAGVHPPCARHHLRVPGCTVTDGHGSRLVQRLRGHWFSCRHIHTMKLSSVCNYDWSVTKINVAF